MKITQKEKNWNWENNGISNSIYQNQGIDIVLTQKINTNLSSVRFYSDPAHGLFAVLLNYLGISNIILPDNPKKGHLCHGIFNNLEDLILLSLPKYNTEKDVIEMKDEGKEIYAGFFQIGAHYLGFQHFAYKKEGKLVIATTSDKETGLNINYINKDEIIVPIIFDLEKKLVYDKEDAKIILDFIYQHSPSQKRLYDLLNLK